MIAKVERMTIERKKATVMVIKLTRTHPSSKTVELSWDIEDRRSALPKGRVRS
jgi:hypothetical protein